MPSNHIVGVVLAYPMENEMPLVHHIEKNRDVVI
jgi:hypothetical protein